MADPSSSEGQPMSRAEGSPNPTVVENQAQATLEAQRLGTIKPDNKAAFLAANPDLQKTKGLAALGRKVHGWWNGIIHHPLPSHNTQMKAVKGVVATSVAVVGTGAGIRAAQEVAPNVQDTTQSVVKNVNDFKIPNPLGEGGFLSAPTATGASHLDQKPPTYGPMSYEGEVSGPGGRQQLEKAAGSQQDILERNTTPPPSMTEFSTEAIHNQAVENRKKYGSQYYDPGGNYTYPEDAAASQNTPRAPKDKPIPYDDPSQNPANVTFEPINDPGIQATVDAVEQATTEASAPESVPVTSSDSAEIDATPTAQAEPSLDGTPTPRPTSKEFGAVRATVNAVNTQQAADVPIDPSGLMDPSK